MVGQWWQPIVQWGLWFVVMSLVMGWLAWSRLRPRAASESRRLVHPLSTFIMGAVCAGSFLALLVLINLFSSGTVTWWANTIFASFALLSFTMVSAYFLDKHEVSEAGLSYTPMFRWTRKDLAWADVQSLRYNPLMTWFTIKGADRTARLSVLLMGLPEFARLALAHAPNGVIDKATADVLRTTAEGRPPSVWM